MNSFNKLAVRAAGVMAIATLVGTSAFAESSHRDATEGVDHAQSRREARSDNGQNSSRHDRNQSQNNDRSARHESNGSAPQTFQRHDSRLDEQINRSQVEANRNRNYDRSQIDSNRNRSYDRSDIDNNRNRTYDRSQAESYRNHDDRNYNDRNYNDRNYNYNRGYGNHSYGNNRSYGNHNSRPDYDERGRRSTSLFGRVNRFEHERGGYRIWIDGGRFPVWIPEARISLFPRLRVGLSLNFGGYYDPRGYLEAYDYYDGAGYYGAGAYSSGLLRGVVETVDYRRGTLVLRDETSGAFVTTLIRDLRLEDLRPGDFAEISGEWTRSGVFEGLRLEDVQGGRY